MLHEFGFYTYFEGIERVYDWEQDHLWGQNGLVNFATHPYGAELEQYIEQQLWERSLPESREVVIDENEGEDTRTVAIFLVRIDAGTAVWYLHSIRQVWNYLGDSTIVTPTAEMVQKAYELLGNPFISQFTSLAQTGRLKQWREFEDFDTLERHNTTSEPQ